MSVWVDPLSLWDQIGKGENEQDGIEQEPSWPSPSALQDGLQQTRVYIIIERSWLKNRNVEQCEEILFFVGWLQVVAVTPRMSHIRGKCPFGLRPRLTLIIDVPHMVPMHGPQQERHPHSWWLWFDWKHPKVKPTGENKRPSVYIFTSPC